MGAASSVVRQFWAPSSEENEPSEYSGVGGENEEFMDWGGVNLMEEQLCEVDTQLIKDGRELSKKQQEWERKLNARRFQIEEGVCAKNRELIRLKAIMDQSSQKTTSAQGKLRSVLQSYETFSKNMAELKNVMYAGEMTIGDDANTDSSDDASFEMADSTSSSISPSDSASNAGKQEEAAVQVPGPSTAGAEAAKKVTTRKKSSPNIRNKSGKTKKRTLKRTRKTPPKRRTKKGSPSRQPETAVKSHGLDTAATNRKTNTIACLCGVICRSMKTHSRHVEHATSNGKFQCRRCPKIFMYYGHLTQHQRQKHGLSNGGEQQGGGVGCRKCGLVFINRVALHYHQKNTNCGKAAPTVQGESSPRGGNGLPSNPNPEPPRRPVSSTKANKRKLTQSRAQRAAAKARRDKRNGNRQIGVGAGEMLMEMTSDEDESKSAIGLRDNKIFRCGRCSIAFALHVEHETHVCAHEKVQSWIDSREHPYAELLNSDASFDFQ